MAEFLFAELVSPLVIEADGQVVPIEYGFAREYALGDLHAASLAELMTRCEGSNSLPLCEKARVEVYLPDLPRAAYQDLLTALAREFTYTFGGCTIVSGLDGSYLSQAGVQIPGSYQSHLHGYALRLRRETSKSFLSMPTN